MTTEQIQEEISNLERELSGNMFSDMDIRDKIHNLKMKLNGVKPLDQVIECVGCGS